MKKTLCALVVLFLLAAVVPAFAEDAAEGYTVTYLENDCLASVPEDETVYSGGETVEVLFEPVTYKDYLIFYGWDINDDGIADFGYNYKYFTMPAEDVELKAICISAYGSAPSPKPGPKPGPWGPKPGPWTPKPGPKPDPWGPKPGPWGPTYMDPAPGPRH